MATGERRRNLGLRRAPWILDYFSTNSTRHIDCFLLYTNNARTVSSDAALYELLDAASHIKYHVIVLQETKSWRTDLRRMNDGTLIIRDEKLLSRNVGSVGFVVHPSVVHLVDSHEILSPRFAILRLRHMHMKTISIVDSSSPHSTADELELDAFHDQLGEIIHNEKSFYKFVVGVFNARLGEAQEEEFSTGKFGMGDRNKNGNRLVGLLSATRLFHGNSFFQKKEHRRLQTVQFVLSRTKY
uniref:Endo/exonuclease/phosphatase domain-containing protein n=1 Tax=Haemonchus contortus TaxID=6289 RepID=A0A7I5EEF3_HAECO